MLKSNNQRRAELTKRAQRSFVWTFFNKNTLTIGSDGRKRLRCQLCREDNFILYENSSTTSMINHLGREHDVFSTNYKAAKRSPRRLGVLMSDSESEYSSDDDETRKSKEKDAETHKSNTITQNLLEFIVCHNQPFTIVEDPTFRKLVHSLDPNYKLPSRGTVSDFLIPQMVIYEL